MADAYTRFIRSAPGGMLAKQLGLPRPSRLLRRKDRPAPVLGPVVVLGASYRGRVKETAFSGVFPTVEALRAKGAEVLVQDPMYTDEELAGFGWTPCTPCATPGPCTCWRRWPPTRPCP
mgnify:CR=1 FL=1